MPQNLFDDISDFPSQNSSGNNLYGSYDDISDFPVQPQKTTGNLLESWEKQWFNQPIPYIGKIPSKLADLAAEPMMKYGESGDDWTRLPALYGGAFLHNVGEGVSGLLSPLNIATMGAGEVAGSLGRGAVELSKAGKIAEATSQLENAGRLSNVARGLSVPMMGTGGVKIHNALANENGIDWTNLGTGTIEGLMGWAGTQGGHLPKLGESRVPNVEGQQSFDFGSHPEFYKQQTLPMDGPYPPMTEPAPYPSFDVSNLRQGRHRWGQSLEGMNQQELPPDMFTNDSGQNLLLQMEPPARPFATNEPIIPQSEPVIPQQPTPIPQRPIDVPSASSGNLAKKIVVVPNEELNPEYIANMAENGYEVYNQTKTHTAFRVKSDETGAVNLESIRQTLRSVFGREPTEPEVQKAAFEQNNSEVQPGEQTGRVAPFEGRIRPEGAPRPENVTTPVQDPIELRRLEIEDRYMRTGRALDNYRLPDGRVVPVDATATKGVQTTPFQLKDGSMVDMEYVGPHDPNQVIGPDGSIPGNVTKFPTEQRAEFQNIANRDNVTMEGVRPQRGVPIVHNPQLGGFQHHVRGNETWVTHPYWDEPHGPFATSEEAFNHALDYQDTPEFRRRLSPGAPDYLPPVDQYGSRPEDAHQSSYPQDPFNPEFPDDLRPEGERLSFPNSGLELSDPNHPLNRPSGSKDIPTDQMNKYTVTPDGRLVKSGPSPVNEWSQPTSPTEGQGELPLGPSSELVPRELVDDANLYPSNESLPEGTQPKQRSIFGDEKGSLNTASLGKSWQSTKEATGWGQGASKSGKMDPKAINYIKEAIALPGAATTTMDFSAPGRQGLALINTKQFWQAIPKMFKGVSEKAFDVMDAELRSKDLMTPRIDSKGKIGKSFGEEIGIKLYRPASKPGLHAESIASRWLETGGSIPYFSKAYKNTLGVPIRASNRAYITFLNHLNVNRAEFLLNKARDMAITGIEKGEVRQGVMPWKTKVSPEQAMDLNPYHNVVLAKEIADFVNTATGHAPLKMHILPFKGAELSLEGAAGKLNGVLFSPGLLFSRMRMLNPNTYIMASPFVRKQYMKAALATAGAWYGFTEMAKKAGGDQVTVNNDPTNADFGKVRIGDTRMDPGGGFSQFLVAYGRMYMGGATSSASGEFHRFGSGYQAQTQEDMMQRFFVNKLNPVSKFAYDLYSASEYNPFHVGDRVAQLFTPLVIQDMIELGKEDPSLLPWMAPVSLGMGTQTYSKGESVGKLVNPENDWLVTGGGAQDLMPWNWNAQPGQSRPFPWSNEQ